MYSYQPILTNSTKIKTEHARIKKDSQTEYLLYGPPPGEAPSLLSPSKIVVAFKKLASEEEVITTPPNLASTSDGASPSYTENTACLMCFIHQGYVRERSRIKEDTSKNVRITSKSLDTLARLLERVHGSMSNIRTSSKGIIPGRLNNSYGISITKQIKRRSNKETLGTMRGISAIKAPQN